MAWTAFEDAKNTISNLFKYGSPLNPNENKALSQSYYIKKYGGGTPTGYDTYDYVAPTSINFNPVTADPTNIIPSSQSTGLLLVTGAIVLVVALLGGGGK